MHKHVHMRTFMYFRVRVDVDFSARLDTSGNHRLHTHIILLRRRDMTTLTKPELKKTKFVAQPQTPASKLSELP